MSISSNGLLRVRCASISDVSEPAVAREYKLGVNDLDCGCIDEEPGRLSSRDMVMSASDLVKDMELLLRTWFLKGAGDLGRLCTGRAEKVSVCIR